MQKTHPGRISLNVYTRAPKSPPSSDRQMPTKTNSRRVVPVPAAGECCVAASVINHFFGSPGRKEARRTKAAEYSADFCCTALMVESWVRVFLVHKTQNRSVLLRILLMWHGCLNKYLYKSFPVRYFLQIFVPSRFQ